MGTISVSLPADGSTADVSDYNTPITTIVNDYNGNIDNTNIKTGAAIDGSKIATSTVSVTQLATGVAVQMVSSLSNAVTTGTTTIPNDDTIPQNTEGDQYLSLAVTPKSTTNILVIQVKLQCSISNANDGIAALFQDTTANALAATATYQATATGGVQLVLTYTMTAGTTSATTFKVRAGPGAAGTMTINGAGAVRRFGGITQSSIVITEYKA